MTPSATDMDHSEAMRLQAAEKYVLGELSGELRDAYEEHYFECSECALDVRAAAMFMEGGRQLATESSAARARAASEELSWRDRWFGSWLWPAFAAPVFAILIAAVIYQNAVTIPRLRSTASAQVYGSSFSLMGANVRGGSGVEITVRPNEGFLLSFDFTPSASANSYVVELQDASGKVLLQSAVPGSETNQSLHFAVPAGVVHSPGQYSLVFYATGAEVPNSSAEVQRLSFHVAFRS